MQQLLRLLYILYTPILAIVYWRNSMRILETGDHFVDGHRFE